MAKQNKFLILPFIAMLVVSLIFLSAQIPVAKTEMKGLPIGLVTEDKGDSGKTIAENLKKNAPEAVKFITYSSIKEMNNALDERKAYGALVIPKDFSNNLASLSTDDAKKATVHIYINEGMNATVASVVETALQNMTTAINAQVSAQILDNMQKATDEVSKTVATQLEAIAKVQAQTGQAPSATQSEQAQALAKLPTMISVVQPKNVALLANPIESKVTKVNAVGKLGSLPSALFMTTWITSILGGVMLYLAGNKRSFDSLKNKLMFRTLQSMIPIVYGFFAGYVITLFSTWILGYSIDRFHTVALFVSLAIIAFTYLVLAVLRWLKLGSIALFVLLMFFGLPIVQLAPEMIPAFYQDYFINWLPIRFLVEGLKDILFFGENVMNDNGIVLLWIAIVAFIVLWIKNLIEKTAK